jgi:hypothetical protein
MTDWVDEILTAERPRGRGGVLAESAEGERGRKGFRKISYEKTEGKRR